MGDATNVSESTYRETLLTTAKPPVIKAGSGFKGDTLLNGKDPSVGVAGEISFSVGVKNVILDTTAVNASRFKTVLQEL